jgi:hypothetical protein
MKVKNFQPNYLVSEKFLTKFSYFFESENFQNLKTVQDTSVSETETETENENFQNLKADLKVKIFRNQKVMKIFH